jgi:cellulose synthase operon protein C
MQITTNVRVLGYLLLSLVVLGTGLHFLHAYQVRRNATAYLAQADREEQRGDKAEAVDSLQRYLGFRPDDNEVLARYGLLLDELARARGTRPSQVRKLRAEGYFRLEQALRRSPQRDDLRQVVIRLAMDLGQYGEAAKDIESLLRPGSEPNAEMELKLARCQIALGEYQKAEKTLQSSEAHDKAFLDAYLEHAELLRDRLKRPTDANDLMDRLFDNVPHSARAFIARADFRRRASYPAEPIAQDLAEARKLAPDDADVLLATARAADRPENARETLRRGIELYPGDCRMYLDLCRVEMQSGQFAAAAECLRKGLEHASEDKDKNELRWFLAFALLADDQHDAAARVIDELKKQDISQGALTLLQGLEAVQQRKWFAASQRLERAYTLLPGASDLARGATFLLGRCHERLGASDQRIAVYRRALAADSEWSFGRLQLATALLAGGKTNEATEECQRLVDAGRPNPAASLLLARCLLRRHATLPPNHPERKETLERAAEALDQADKGGANAVDRIILRAGLLVAQNHETEAHQRLLSASERHADQPLLRIAFANLTRRQAGADKAKIAQAQAMLTKVPAANVDILLAKLQVALAFPPKEARELLAGLAVDAAKLPPGDQDRMQFALAGAYVQMGTVDQAEQIWKRIADADSNDLSSRLALFDRALERSDNHAMLVQVAAIRRIEGADSYWKYCEAARQVRRAEQGNADGSFAKARDSLMELAKEHPDWARIPVLLGRIADRENDTSQAVELYQRAIQLGETRFFVVRRAVQLLYARHNYSKAEELLQKLGETLAFPRQITQLAAEVALADREHPPDRGLELARNAIPANSTDYRDYLWLAQMLTALDPKEAERFFHKALDLGGDKPETWVAYIQFLARAKKVDRCKAAIADAQKRVPRAELGEVLAYAFEITGDPSRAEEQYRARLNKDPHDAGALEAIGDFYVRQKRSAEAEPHLRELLKQTAKATPEVQASARRRLAIALASTGVYQKALEAQTLLRENASRTGGNRVEDERTAAVVLAGIPGQEAQAIGRLDAVKARAAFTHDDEFLLAKLYDRSKRWPDTRQLMLKLLYADSENVSYLTYFIARLLDQGQKDEAALWLEKLQKVAPESVATLELVGQLLHDKGRGEQTVSLVQDYAAKHTDADLFKLAAFLERWEQLNAAETMYRRAFATSTRPADASFLIGFLSRHNRMPEALDLCEKAWDSVPPIQAAALSVTVLRNGGPPDRTQCERVEKWITRALRTHPEMPMLLDMLADLETIAGRTSSAEAHYRQSLATNGRDVWALNNLAWLLAHQEGKAEASLELVQRALDLAGPVPASLDTRALGYLATGRIDAALKDLEEAADVQPGPSTYFHLAQACVRDGNLVRGREALKKARRSMPGLGSIHPLELSAYNALIRELNVN